MSSLEPLLLVLVILGAAALVWLVLRVRVLSVAKASADKRLAQLNATLEAAQSEKGVLEATVTSLQEHYEAGRKTVEQALESARAARDEAERSAKAKSTFLATMSHEIRTPLNCIRGLSEVLSATDASDEQKGHLSAISQSVDALLAIIGNVLDFSKIEAGKLELQRDRVDLQALVNGVADMLRNSATSKGLAFDVSIEPDAPLQIIADGTHLRQVLVNLLGNAIKFTETGAVTLTVTRQRVEDPDVPKGKILYDTVFRVADTGIGIPKDKQDQLFQPFSQLVGSKTRKYEGTGLGLAISKRIVEEGMNGTITHYDNEPQGSIFEVSVRLEGFLSPPKKKPASKLTKTGLYAHALGQSFYNLNILVADDNMLNCRVMKAMLEKMGHKADFVQNGRDAVEWLIKNDADLVLMDVMMPLMDGVEATQCIRRGDCGEDKKDIPVVALTAFALTSDRDEFLSKGMDFYLPKPIEPDALRETLTIVARKAREKSASAS